MEIAGANAESIVAAVQNVASQPDLYLHCWRGGMRSEGVGWLLKQCQFRPRVIRGGYKAFRRAARECFDTPRQIVILGGLTGSGKTELLRSLRGQGEQVVDLEQLAHRRRRWTIRFGLGAGGVPVLGARSSFQCQNCASQWVRRLCKRCFNRDASAMDLPAQARLGQSRFAFSPDW